MSCEKLVQSASLYSHRITRINALQGRLVWARIRDETRRVLTQHGWRWSIKFCVCLYERMRTQACTLLSKLSMKVIYEHAYMHMYVGGSCMQRWTLAGITV